MTDVNASGDARATGGVGLRRELRIWEALGLSIGLASPTLAMSFSGVGAAGLVGRAVPLAFLFGGIVLLFIASGMVIVSRNYAHAGSVYGLTGATIGPRAGFFSGWALAGCYLVFCPSAFAAAGYFVALFLHDTSIWPGATDGFSFVWFSLAFALLCWALNLAHVRNLTRTMLSIEGVSVTLLVIVIVVIFVRLGVGHSPNSQATFSLAVLSPQIGGIHGIALASVFAFLAFAGFEGAMSLGEETHAPTRTIPRALIVATVGIAVFYFITMIAEAMGFGATLRGGNNFAGSSGPLVQLAQSYVAAPMGWALELGAAVSAFGSALASSAGCARLIYAISRDARPSSSLASVTKHASVPGAALAIVMIFAIVSVFVLAVVGNSGLDIWNYLGTTGTLLILVAYALVNAGAVRHLVVNRTTENVVAVIGPGLAVLFVLFILFNELYPAPAAPYNVFPYLDLAWLVVGLLIVLLVPGLAKRIGQGLSAQEGLIAGARSNRASSEGTGEA
ncbi:MAG: APC family permease [Candidatus Dormibacteraceae bacterium]